MPSCMVVLVIVLNRKWHTPKQRLGKPSMGRNRCSCHYTAVWDKSFQYQNEAMSINENKIKMYEIRENLNETVGIGICVKYDQSETIRNLVRCDTELSSNLCLQLFYAKVSVWYTEIKRWGFRPTRKETTLKQYKLRAAKITYREDVGRNERYEIQLKWIGI